MDDGQHPCAVFENCLHAIFKHQFAMQTCGIVIEIAKNKNS